MFPGRHPAVTITTLTEQAARRVERGAPAIRREDIVSVEGATDTSEPIELRDPEGMPVGIGDFAEGEGEIAVRRLGLPHESAEGFIPRQVRRAMERRAMLVDDPRYCRFINDEGDAMPGLAVDRFDGHFAVQTTTRAMDRRLEEIVRSLVEVAQARSVILRNDSQRRERAGLPKERSRVLWGTPPRWTRLLELGARLSIDLLHGSETGYSYALREVRRTVERLSESARVLDPSCFVGGTIVQAGLGGAREIVAFAQDFESADLARENVEANGLMNRAAVDVATPLEALRALDRTFDLVLLHASARGPDRDRWTQELDELILLSLKATRHGGRLLIAAPDAALGSKPLEAHVLLACDAEGRAAYRLLRPAAPADFPAPAGAPDALASVVLEIA
ncbi:MAG: class I SAM-dependent methyltransferase [Myxococcaceae bacterium]|nr:class I SAM-dependent methyltransferase [Myxococcaceae bacterium]